MTLPTLNLGPDLEATLASGHPWVYRNRLPRHNLQTGQWLRLEAGRSSAVGLYDDEGQIDHVQGTDGFPYKPAPDVVLRALAAVAGDGLWLVGDTTTDIEAGRAAGLRTYAVTMGYPRRRAARRRPARRARTESRSAARPALESIPTGRDGPPRFEPYGRPLDRCVSL